MNSQATGIRTPYHPSILQITFSREEKGIAEAMPFQFVNQIPTKPTQDRATPTLPASAK